MTYLFVCNRSFFGNLQNLKDAKIDTQLHTCSSSYGFGFHCVALDLHLEFFITNSVLCYGASFKLQV